MHFSFRRRPNALKQRRLRDLRWALVFLLLISISCTQGPSNSPPAPSPVVKKDNYIKATPNPVPAGPGVGTTTISWATKDIPAVDVHVFVAAAGGPENLFATAPEGSQDAPWISSDAPFEFRLYSGSGSDRKLLDKVVVTRNK